MYRVRLPAGVEPAAGDALYSPEFGPEQASGTLVNVAPAADASFEALAVVQRSSARDGAAHWKTPGGPQLEFLQLPYSIPD
jgi:hypothetical protein